MQYTLKDLLALIDEDNIVKLVEIIDDLGIADPAYERLKKEFIQGASKHDIDFHNRWKVFVRAENVKKALEGFSITQTNDEKNAEFYFQQAKQKFELQDYHGSIQDYTKAIQLDANYPNPYSGRGNIKCIFKDYEGAIQDYNKVIELDYTHSIAYYNHGLVKLILKDKKSACFDLKMAKQFGHKEAEKMLEEYCQ